MDVPPLLLLLLLLSLLPSHFSSSPLSSPPKRCPSPLFRQSRRSSPLNGTSPHYLSPIHFFAITQDCQFVLARPDQLGQLPSLSVTSSSVECAPSRINLLWSLNSPSPSLLLLQQRAPDQLCLLPIEMPFSVIYYSAELFRYSLRNALLHFAHCHATNLSSSLSPDLLFADPLYSDLLYFLDPSPSPDTFWWTAHQFLLSSLGSLRPRDTFRRVKPMLENLSHAKAFLGDASPFLLAFDAQRKRLFAVPRAQGDLDAEAIRWTCPFDLLFRPQLVRLRPLSLFPRSKSLLSPDSRLVGFAVDRNVAIFSECVPNSSDNFVYVAKLRGGNAKPSLAESHCVLKLPYGAKFGVISEQTLRELRSKGPLPQIGDDKRKVRPPAEMPALTTESAASARDQSAGIASAEAIPNTPRGHVISMPKAQTAPSKETTKKMVVDQRIEPFWKATTAKAAETTTTTMKTETTEKKIRLEGEGEEEGEEGDGEWSNDYEQWRDQTAGEAGDDVVVPLREEGIMGPAHFRQKLPSARDKSAGQMNGGKNAWGAAGGRVPFFASAMPLALSILIWI